MAAPLPGKFGDGALGIGRGSVSGITLATTISPWQAPTSSIAAKALGIKLRGGGIRTGPLTSWQLRQLGLQDLANELSAAAGRPVHFMVYQSPEAATARSPSITAASESEISTAARAAAPTEGAPSEGEPVTGGADPAAGAGAADVLGVIGWILLFIDAQKHGGIFSP